MTYIVGITGSRRFDRFGIVQDSIAAEYRKHKGNISFKVGDCKTGVDRITKNFLTACGWEYEEFKADWKRFGDAAGPIRNHAMVDSGMDLLLAFPDDDSKGTKDCAKYAAGWDIKVKFPELSGWSEWAAPIASYEA